MSQYCLNVRGISFFRGLFVLNIYYTFFKPEDVYMCVWCYVIMSQKAIMASFTLMCTQLQSCNVQRSSPRFEFLLWVPGLRTKCNVEFISWVWVLSRGWARTEGVLSMLTPPPLPKKAMLCIELTSVPSCRSQRCLRCDFFKPGNSFISLFGLLCHAAVFYVHTVCAIFRCHQPPAQ